MRSCLNCRLLVWLFIGLSTLADGCKLRSDRRYSVEMTAGPRKVKVNSDKVASITFDNPRFVISLSATKCIVEPERVLYDGKEQARIPGEASVVVIEFIDGNFSIVADGQTVRAPSPPN